MICGVQLSGVKWILTMEWVELCTLGHLGMEVVSTWFEIIKIYYFHFTVSATVMK